MQQVENRGYVLACAFCHKFVGPLRLQAALLAGRVSRVEVSSGDEIDESKLPDLGIPNSSGAAADPQDFLCCKQGCGEIYCSQACADADHKSNHWLLCTGPIDSAEHPLVQFKAHACETNDIFLLVARALAEAISRWKSNGRDLQAAVLPLQAFHSLQWWDVVAPGRSDPELRQQCEELVSDSG
mmetsp:Transcript_11359/g.32246  ORF Transcript_11359/g.32246 Transcript_11359/m.32246 type:complete len:184 (+) Transcript_11359:499-1050(+)